MKILTTLLSARAVSSKIFIICLITTASQSSSARNELPFCPSGGPPGWMNYFDNKRDQNIRRHQNYPSYNYRPWYRSDYNRSSANGPAYLGPYLQAPATQIHNPLSQ